MKIQINCTLDAIPKLLSAVALLLTGYRVLDSWVAHTHAGAYKLKVNINVYKIILITLKNLERAQKAQILKKAEEDEIIALVKEQQSKIKRSPFFGERNLISVGDDILPS